ncbi:methionyl-tRNA formyltransferase [Mucilaginibacter celer]|uniref:Methionyl-tRNA formyltransferase n=1 Tax=Mucilaginibacter celer TaxID=2305508 RepID=A0A494VLK4_9SPHI|nr:formyltransferase family protein [Mucilaginibacter celer]AYL96137.1 methionyl-tRNA formyltransferase [Mucilaginibacter celer]
MKIGIVSNSKICIPLLSYLSNYNKAGVMLYLGKSENPDLNINEIIGFCKARNISVYTEHDKEELYAWQQMLNPDILFFSGYSHKVSVARLEDVKYGVYNIHFGKLPVFRGPSPVFWQLKKGEPNLSLTIHRLSDKFDSGAVVWEHHIKNEEHCNYSYVNDVFSDLQVRGVLDVLEYISHNRPLNQVAQDETRAVYYNKPQLADIMINWEQMTAREIINLIKACTPWNRGASSLINGHELKILDAEQVPVARANTAPGTIDITNKTFNVTCVNGASLNVNFFNINNTSIPARHAGFYGLKTGQQFMSKL